MESTFVGKVASTKLLLWTAPYFNSRLYCKKLCPNYSFFYEISNYNPCCNSRDDYEKVIHSNDAFAPVGYLKLRKAHLVKKPVSFPLDNYLTMLVMS